MYEKILHVVYPFHAKVIDNMTYLGYELKVDEVVRYSRRMNVISDDNYLANKAIHKLVFTIDDDKYDQNKEEIDNYLAILEERYKGMKRYKFCIPIIIVSSYFFINTAFLIGLFIQAGGPLQCSPWVYILYVLSFGFGNEIYFWIMTILVYIAAAICLGAIIFFSIKIGIAKKYNNNAIIYNDELSKKKSVRLKP